jgi:hypothetical protein
MTQQEIEKIDELPQSLKSVFGRGQFKPLSKEELMFSQTGYYVETTNLGWTPSQRENILRLLMIKWLKKNKFQLQTILTMSLNDMAEIIAAMHQDDVTAIITGSLN